MAYGAAGGRTYDIPRRTASPQGQAGAQTPNRQVVEPMDDLLETENLTSDYFALVGNIESFAKSMWENYQIDVTKSDPMSQMSGEANRKYLKAVQTARTIGNQLKREGGYKNKAVQGTISSPDVRINQQDPNRFNERDIINFGETDRLNSANRIDGGVFYDNVSYEQAIVNQEAQKVRVEEEIRNTTDVNRLAELNNELEGIKDPKLDDSRLRAAAANAKDGQRWSQMSLFNAFKDSDSPDINILREDANVESVELSRNQPGVWIVKFKDGSSSVRIDLHSSDSGLQGFTNALNKTSWKNVNTGGYTPMDATMGKEFDYPAWKTNIQGNVSGREGDMGLAEFNETAFIGGLTGDGVFNTEISENDSKDKVKSDEIAANKKKNKVVKDFALTELTKQAYTMDAAGQDLPTDDDGTILSGSSYKVVSIKESIGTFWWSTDGIEVTVIDKDGDNKAILFDYDNPRHMAMFKRFVESNKDNLDYGVVGEDAVNQAVLNLNESNTTVSQQDLDAGKRVIDSLANVTVGRDTIPPVSSGPTPANTPTTTNKIEADTASTARPSYIPGRSELDSLLDTYDPNAPAVGSVESQPIGPTQGRPSQEAVDVIGEINDRFDARTPTRSTEMSRSQAPVAEAAYNGGLDLPNLEGLIPESETAVLFTELVGDKGYELGAKGFGNYTVGNKKTLASNVDCSGAVCKVQNARGGTYKLEGKTAQSFMNSAKVKNISIYEAIDGDMIAMDTNGSGVIDHIGFIVVDADGNKYIAEATSSYGGSVIVPLKERLDDLESRKGANFAYNIVSDKYRKKEQVGVPFI